MKKCNKCKLDYSNDINFCKKCGSSLDFFESAEEKKEKEEKAKKNKKIWDIVRYVFGVLIIFGSISDFHFYSIPGILFGLSLLPIVHEKLFEIKKIKENKLIIKLKKAIQIGVPIVLGFIWALCLPGEQLESITINDDGHVIAVTEKYEIDFETNLTETDKSNFEYTTSDNNVATIENGIITGISEGNVTVTIKGDNSIEEKAEYQIKYVDIEKMEISGNTKLLVGKSDNLEISTTPSIVSDKIVRWESSDPTIISVDNDGKVTANNKGKVIVTAFTEKGKTATIEVGSFVEITSMTINETDPKVEKGKTITLTVFLQPDNADAEGITWSSSDNNIATVENGVITGKSEGNATITATSVNGVKTSSKIEVYEVKPESVSLSQTSINLNVGQTQNISATVNPGNASDKSVSWSSSKSSVASVENGVITAKSIGTATITARTSNGKTATVEVTVKKNAPIKVNNFKYTMDSVCGVEWTFSITNNSGKTINYVTLKWYNFNGVGDFVYDQINAKNYVQLKYTGPLVAGGNSGSKRNTSKFYNCSYKSSAISDVKIDYADGTSETISSSDMKYYNNLY